MGFIRNIFEAISENLISGDAYYLIAKSVFVTLAIAVTAWILAAVLGCLISYFMCYEKKLVSRIAEGFCFLFRSAPALLIILLFYYVFYKGSHINPILICGFALGFYGAGHFAELLAKAVKDEQRKLSSETSKKLERLYYTTVLPQALEDSLFHIKRLTVHILQWTTIVGYISVNDLTEVMNRIGQRTMYPFFSIFFCIICYLIATLVIEGIFKLIQKKLK